MRGLSLVAASGGHSSSRCAGLSLSRPLLLRSTGSRRVGSVVVAHGPSCSAACGIFPDQGLNPCHLHWQADSQPLRHQGSPRVPFIAHGYLFVPASFVEILFSLHQVIFAQLSEIVDHICMGLILCFLFCFLDLYIYFSLTPTIFIFIALLSLKNEVLWVFQLYHS